MTLMIDENPEWDQWDKWAHSLIGKTMRGPFNGEGKVVSVRRGVRNHGYWFVLDTGDHAYRAFPK